jgi:polysaccharide export outer membrane protein
VALAGGFGAAGPLRGSAFSEFLSADERVRQLAFEHSALLIYRARLEAQRDRSEISTPAELPPGEEFTQFIANEKATLGSRTALLKTQIDLLENQKPRLQEETSATKGEIATAKSRLEFVRNEARRSAQLVQQGLGVHTLEIQLKLAETNEETNIWRLMARLSRLQMDIGDLDIKIQETKAAFEKEALAELQKVRERLAELNVTLPAARQFRDFKLQRAESAGEVEADRSFNITRARRGQVVVFQGTETTRLEPGDVVDVKKAPSISY